MSGRRLIVGVIFMGVLLPITLYYLLELQGWASLVTIAVANVLVWGVVDLFATILERPRLQNRSARGAFREDWERRRHD